MNREIYVSRPVRLRAYLKTNGKKKGVSGRYIMLNGLPFLVRKETLLPTSQKN